MLFEKSLEKKWLEKKSLEKNRSNKSRSNKSRSDKSRSDESRVNKSRVNKRRTTFTGPSLPPIDGCNKLVEIIATLIFFVGPYHRHVGNVAAWFRDPCFSPTAWRDGEWCGTPQDCVRRDCVARQCSLGRAASNAKL